MSNLVRYEEPEVYIGGFWSSLKRAVRSVGRRIGKIEKGVEHATKDVIHSKYLKVGVSGLAIAFPAVGVPAMAAVVTADKVLNAVDTAKSTAEKLKLQKVINNTIANAKAGNKGSQRAVAALNAAAKIRAQGIKSINPNKLAMHVPKVSGVLVDGALKVPGTFERTGEGTAHIVMSDGMIVRGKFRKVA